MSLWDFNLSFKIVHGEKFSQKQRRDYMPKRQQIASMSPCK
jgi:hypothetical protein